MFHERFLPLHLQQEVSICGIKYNLKLFMIISMWSINERLVFLCKNLHIEKEKTCTISRCAVSGACASIDGSYKPVCCLIIGIFYFYFFQHRRRLKGTRKKLAKSLKYLSAGLIVFF